MNRFELKRVVKAVGRGVSGRWLAGAPSSRVVVLCYHSIHPTSAFASASPSAFARHLEWLATSCDVVPLAEIPSLHSVPRSRPAVAITFDDGYLDNYEIAFPMLQRYGLPATFFVTVGFLEKDSGALARQQALRGADAADVRPLEWSQLRTMHAAGMEIGAHTYSHPNLAVLSDAQVLDELTRSKRILEDRLGRRVRAMAYPFGKPGCHFTARTAALVQHCGYEYACAILFRAVRHTDSPFAIPRLFVTRDTVEGLRGKVHGAWDLIGLWQERCPLWLARAVSPEDFLE